MRRLSELNNLQILGISKSMFCLIYFFSSCFIQNLYTYLLLERWFSFYSFIFLQSGSWKEVIRDWNKESVFL